MSIYRKKPSDRYKTRFYESFRTVWETHPVLILLYVLAFVLFFLALEQDRSFSAYIPTGLFYSVLDILLPIAILFTVIFLQKKEYPMENQYGEKSWLYRQSMVMRKFLRFFTNLIVLTAMGALFYYSIGALASIFPQNYTAKTYTVNITELFGYGHNSCKRSIQTDFLDQVNIENQSLYVSLVKKLNLSKLCMDHKTFESMSIGKRISISTQESPIWGIYINKFDDKILSQQ